MLAILLYSEAEKQTAQDVVHRMIQRAIEMEGTITGEHGVGLKKRDYLIEELGQETIDAMRKVCFFYTDDQHGPVLIVYQAQAGI